MENRKHQRCTLETPTPGQDTDNTRDTGNTRSPQIFERTGTLQTMAAFRKGAEF